MDARLIGTEREDDTRWLTDVVALPGVMAYGGTRDEALAKAEALALRVLAERLEHGEAGCHPWPRCSKPPRQFSGSRS